MYIYSLTKNQKHYGNYFTTKCSDAATAKGDALRDFSIRTNDNI